MALYLLLMLGGSNMGEAQSLGFYERSDYRHALKRWISLVPSLLS